MKENLKIIKNRCPFFTKPGLAKPKSVLPDVAAHCRFTTYRHRFARAAPAPRAKRNDSKRKIQKIVDVRRLSMRPIFTFNKISLKCGAAAAAPRATRVGLPLRGSGPNC